ncbi:PTS system mannose/fructose/sorbose family transporter subunit IID [Mycoplasmopsis alligatoris]|uniref:PTS system mannose/fructose/sorbose family IID component n=1 Tax=Mycoplasmopsis alligatoris A21JP2 TaxID=747682 RepID=D4XVV7_9BACT|nr:PTS system mannose/fructose/sorbose family transporter subunit IID [Mycoplasmopsis alligatoris]EFF41519.1 PTS system mannose/fructose/sorbose family IID component [Mycoplasmopsis alligatoris A21JP2]
MESNQRTDFVQINESQNPNEALGKLSILMYIWITFRSYLLQSGFNYANFQGLGYANAIYPALKKIYGKGAKLKESLLNNIEFFNSNPQTLPLITSVHLSLLANGQSISDARTIKMSLMGPLAGIGDSLSQFAIFPLFSIIAVGFAQTGSILGPVIFLFGINTILIIMRVSLGLLGYKLGEKAIGKLATSMQTIIRISSMVGVTIIAALAIRLTKVNFALEFSQRIDAGAAGFQVKVISIQEILNNIMPLMAAGIWVMFIYFMVTKYKWSPYKVIIVTILVGITCGVFGILGV